MVEHRELMRFHAGRCERLRDAADTYRLLNGEDVGRSGPRAVFANLLRGAAERLDPAPRVASRAPSRDPSAHVASRVAPRAAAPHAPRPGSI